MGVTENLRKLIAKPGMISMPGVFDAVSARLAEHAGFSAAFMSGFMVSASRIGLPDTGLISYAEMADQGRNICDSVSIPIVGDGDTGFGNSVNVKRTVKGYAAAGFACVMIEDQVSPKRCGHTKGKQIISRSEALQRIQAAVDAREEGADILVMARTDANATNGIEEAVGRCREFQRIGADITFLEAPKTLDEMKRYCNDVEGAKMANMVEQGETPFLSPSELEKIGYKITIWPAALMLSAINGMKAELMRLHSGIASEDGKATFPELQDIVGFPAYYEAVEKYATE
ncbi:MAG: carboxyvinyl-carboxyphosphonate phosphorylmutase [Rhodospirillaceae bacterium TMED8]|nr:carboxyvinyl-carboxyphosphonate phosphorylmutase [Magnetovibrio sp.]OUT52270.1 MAG: carboxyvinyl-carboxyphosphonate phosphorylmutase [Rhodospirillaceae bacterium TMED8]|tara:strand:+ start:2696 stop:3556 length:861 start_codon:yes stop_codon:yes gene_type:complete